MKFSLELSKEILQQTPLVLHSSLSKLSGDWTFGDNGPDTWSPFQVVGHLTHIEESDWIDRTRLIMEHGENRVLEPIDREAGFERFRDLSLIELLDRFAAVRNSNLFTLESLVRAADLDRTGLHPEFGVVRLDQLLAAWVIHDLNHLGQIVKTMAKQYGEAVGPWRVYLPIVDAN